MGDQMRPLYENETHLEIERKIAKLFEQIYACVLRKMPIRHYLDFAIEQDGQIRGFLEIKTSSYTCDEHRRYGGFKLSLHKWSAARQLSQASGLPFFLVVGFPEAVCGMRIEEFNHDGVMWWGRRDRNDDQDMEPAVVLNIDRFSLLR